MSARSGANAVRPAAPRLWAVAALVTGLLALAGCSSSGEGDGSDATLIPETVVTADPGTTVAPPSGSTSSASTPTTTGSPNSGEQPSSPSSLPADLTGVCAPLRETYGVADIRPRDSSSWVDERQRVVVDARREADLLAVARSSAPAVVAGDLATLASYATFVADTVAGADSYGAAVATLDSGPARGPVDTAAASVVSWRSANC